MWQCKRYPLHCHICVFLLDLNIPHFINESKKMLFVLFFTLFALYLQWISKVGLTMNNSGYAKF